MLIQTSSWWSSGASPGTACGYIGAFPLLPHHVLVSGGLAENLMGHLHLGAIGGQPVFHFSKGPTWCELDFRIVCTHSWLGLSQSCISVTSFGLENPWTSLLWKTSYWRRLEKLRPWSCELRNCMFGGARLKRTCIASTCSAVMSLAIKCDGQHTHAPLLVQQGVFDTSLEAEYAPALAKALAECILEFIAGEFKLPNIQQFSKRLKLSHFSVIAAAKQPSKPEYTSSRAGLV